MRKVCLILIIVSCFGFFGCNEGKVAEEAIDPMHTPIATPQPTMGPAVDAFDPEYVNLQSQNSSIVAANGRVYFTSGHYLYCYDLKTSQKIEIANDIIVGNIYVIDDYIYFLKEQTLNKLDSKTNSVEEVCNAMQMSTLSAESRNFRVRKGMHKFEEFEVQGELIILYYEYYVYGDFLGPPGTDSAYAYADNMNFITLENNHDYSGIYSPNSVKPSFVRNSIIIENQQNTYERFIIFYAVTPIGNNPLVKISYEFDEQYYAASIIGSMVLSGENAYSSSSYTTEFSAIKAHELEGFTQTYEKKISGSEAKVVAIGQYVFCYYYGHDSQDNINGESGIILFDTKNNAIYEDEEINQVISGDIDYKNLMFTDYYLDNEHLYVLENEENVKRISELSKGQQENISDEEIVYSFYGIKYVDFVSKNNLYMVEVLDGKLHFTLLHKEFDRVE